MRRRVGFLPVTYLLIIIFQMFIGSLVPYAVVTARSDVDENLAWIFKLAGFDVIEAKIDHGLDNTLQPELTPTPTPTPNPFSISYPYMIIIVGLVLCIFLVVILVLLLLWGRDTLQKGESVPPLVTFYCEECGNELQPNTIYCPYCGKKVF